MIEIIPAIDIIGGKCVRLTKGDYKQCTTYTQSPLEVAKEFEANGVTRIHLIDLDGAKINNPQNLDVLEAIAKNTNLKIEFGGGIKNRNSLYDALNAGAERVICSSIAVKQPNVFLYWLECFGADKVVLGADVKDGFVAVRGWKEVSDTKLYDLIDNYKKEGIKRVIITDISKDGVLGGPSVELYEECVNRYPKIKIVASGGVSSISDIENLNNTGAAGVIVGKAIYEGKISLKQIQSFYITAKIKGLK